MLKNLVQPEWSQMTWCMRVECLINKATRAQAHARARDPHARTRIRPRAHTQTHRHTHTHTHTEVRDTCCFSTATMVL